MNGRKWLISLVPLAAGVGAFAATLVVRTAASGPSSGQAASAPSPMVAWLDVSPEVRAEIEGDDAAFGDDLRRLRAELAAAREGLAATLEEPGATDEQIRARSEAVLSASAAVERRVTSHLLAIRHHLTVPQQRRLFGLCAQGIRGGGGRGLGGGGGGGRGPGPHGAGGGMGRGGRFAEPATRSE